MTTILAFADLHGSSYAEAARLIDLHQPDWVVLAGDILPEFRMIHGIQRRLEAQRLHWQTYRTEFQREGTTTTFVRGNHEIEGFRDPLLERVPSHLLGRVIRLEGIPIEFGAWGFSREWETEDLHQELEQECAGLRGLPPIVVVSHVPPHGILDQTRHGSSIGHRPLRRMLEERQIPGLLVLCGHVHESFGTHECFGATIVNVATGYALVELRHGRPHVIEMKRIPMLPNNISNHHVYHA